MLCAYPGCQQLVVNAGRCVEHQHHMIPVDGFLIGRVDTPNPSEVKSAVAVLYPKYYKDVSQLNEVDVYAIHKLFNIQDPSGAIQHASKKLLLSGVRTGGKSAYEDVREARDTLTRYLELNKP